jgi:serine protease DegQ
MRRSPLYSRARRIETTEPPAAAPAASEARSASPLSKPRSPRRWAWPLVLLLAIGAGGTWLMHRHTAAPALTLQDIDRAVRASLVKQPLPSADAAAYAKIIPSVVRVVAFESHEVAHGEMAPSDGPAHPLPPAPGSKKAKPPPPEDDDTPSIGTGVVIQDNGTILTNLHVVDGAARVKVQFHDGLISDAQVVKADRSQDLAVIRATRLPDDLQPATLRGTGDLHPGDHVVAVGFPFGIGPSTSAGVVSGLEREFRTPTDGRTLKHLIQFDAAANPGNSGGPLVTQRGEVVGIVTAILNPTPARTFIGIGFAVPIENAAAAVGMPPF